ncbi:DUF1043 family protein [Frischella sp. Ac13]|uniref:Z-ring associated protein G n=1 Tax=Frischella japonica TaxID=2741544 RepID=A0ABR7QUM4_9GAMM|nr:DUF1043 family protein [Frischella japonica]MBC9129830.1 DUF1043 family protein [Frischella japonica]
MNSEIVIYLVIGLAFGITLGIILANVFSPKSRKFNLLQRELEEAKQQLITQKQTIVKHFSHSAEILDNMAKDFRRLYQHMAENSNNLISQEDINSLNIKPTINETDKPTINFMKAQPKDYASDHSGLLKNPEQKQ